MAHLEERKVVHRDLAARNCLVTKNMVVKIADYGLSRDVHYTDYYRKNGQALMPVRWMSPESLEQGYFTTKSDMWAFGVVVWEIFTFGSVPYGSLSNQEVFEQVVGRNVQLDQPEGCPDAVYSLLQEAWNYEEDQRPGFAYVRSNLQDVLSRLELGATDQDLACSTFKGKPWRRSMRFNKYDDTFVVDSDNYDMPAKGNPLDGYTRLDPTTVNAPTPVDMTGMRTPPPTSRSSTPVQISRSQSRRGFSKHGESPLSREKSGRSTAAGSEPEGYMQMKMKAGYENMKPGQQRIGYENVKAGQRTGYENITPAHPSTPPPTNPAQLPDHLKERMAEDGDNDYIKLGNDETSTSMRQVKREMRERRVSTTLRKEDQGSVGAVLASMQEEDSKPGDYDNIQQFRDNRNARSTRPASTSSGN